MKAIVQTRYGSPDVLQLRDVDEPVVSDDQVLVRVHAAAVNIGDWHLLRGTPYVIRLVAGLRRPKREIPGLDIAGQVEAVGVNVKQFQPGDEVFGWCKGAFAEYTCAAESDLLAKPANLTSEQSAAVGDSAFTALAAVRDQGKVQPGDKVLINGASGGVGTFARADREVVRSERDGGLQHKEPRHGPITWRQPGHRLHERGLRPNRAAVRRDARSGRDPFVVGLQACADPPGHLCRRWGKGHGSLAGTRSSDQGAFTIAFCAPADAGVRRAAQQRGPGCSEGTRRSRQGRAGHRQALRLE
jgi:hypothetical protein